MKKLLMTLVLLLGGIFTTYAQSGYRGFADIAVGPAFGTETGIAANLSTTHGYQCNGHIFIGAGIQPGYVSDAYDIQTFSLPVYLTLRYDYSLTSRYSFYGAIRGGYVVFDESGPYIAPEIGVRFGKKGPVSFNLGLRVDIDCFEDATVGSPMIAFGIEF